MAAPPFTVKAVYEYTSEHDDDLKFPVGTIINVTEEEGDDWYVGEYTDDAGVKQEGLFPRNFVKKYEPEVPSRPTRAARPKSLVQQPPPPADEPQEDAPEEEGPPVPAASKPQAVPIEIPPVSGSRNEEVRSPPSATSQETPNVRTEPPAAPKPAPVEPANTSTPSKVAPPPVAPKSNAFKDRIAAFNKVEQSPLAPMQAGRQAPRNDYVKKPFVAPPPKSSYVPPIQKQEPVRRPYVREEDPEIKARQDEDRQAAEAAGLTGEAPSATAAEEEEEVPKPMSLKERMALLQEQQRKQAERNADVSQKKEKKPPVKKPSASSDMPTVPQGEDEEMDEVLGSERTDRKSLEMSRERPRIPSSQRPQQESSAPAPTAPSHDVLSAGEEADHSAAGETEDDAGTIGQEHETEGVLASGGRASDAPAQEPDVGDEEDTAEDVEEGDEEVDEEELRKQRLRERMAKLAGGPPGAAGGMGMAFNPFGAPAPAAAPRKKTSRKSGEDAAPSSPPQAPQQMIAIPGMGGTAPRMQSPESDNRQRGITEQPLQQEPEEEQEDDEPAPPPRKSTAEDRGIAPSGPRADRPVPPPAPAQERGAPPPLPSDSTRPTPRPPPAEARPLPPPPPATSAAPLSPGPGSESDDELSMHAKRSSAETSGIETPLPVRQGGAPPVPPNNNDVPARPPRSPENKRTSYFNNEPSPATSDRRASRVPPPVPGSPLASPRPPPPPPPTAAPPSRQNTELHQNDQTDRGESDYEGDYDTDIASSAKHKDALKSHVRESSLDDSTTADEMTPVTTPLTTAVPPANVPRAVPPPPPPNAPKSRPSMDAPRAAPPPVPLGRTQMEDEDYDPYRYNETSRPVPPLPSSGPPAFPAPLQSTDEQGESSADDVVANLPLTRKSTERAPPPPPSQAPQPQERAPPMPPPPQQAPPPARAAPRESLDVPQRTSTMNRRSMEQSRPAGDAGGQIAQDLDLAQSTQWWTAPQPLPPSLQSRNGVDLLSESEESTKAKRGGRTTITKDIYILFMDHSQTQLTVQYDSREPSDVTLEQRHEPPPPKLRQDQLEGYWQRFGKSIAEAAGAAGHSKKDTVIGDGSAYALPLELIKQQSQALLPVGTRAYGALVYANLANASTQQFDEIRPGDIVTLRNARFEGHHGAMRQKYKIDYGPSHVAVVDEWDGTRRSVRAWEQGREKKGGVRSEKFRLADLRSGEVRVWRVVGRDWVGWDA